MSFGPEERIVACGAGQDLGQGLVGGEERSDHHYHHREPDVLPIHPTPCLSLLKACAARFLLYSSTDTGSRPPPQYHGWPNPSVTGGTIKASGRSATSKVF